MIAEWSHLALVLALPLVGLQLLLAFLPAAPLGLNEALRARAVRGTAVLGAGLISLSFLGLIASFVAGDFSVKTAFENSHSAKPLLYKVSGTWGNHEGSILLWVLILSLFGGLLALTGRGGEARGAAPAALDRAAGLQGAWALRARHGGGRGVDERGSQGRGLARGTPANINRARSPAV
ncbi:MAG: hypothetical protein VX152_07195, partial [Pseudomonadota bacterium]|nr:hypothetical protein [Pseudomonadota bacterium]